MKTLEDIEMEASMVFYGLLMEEVRIKALELITGRYPLRRLK